MSFLAKGDVAFFGRHDHRLHRPRACDDAALDDLFGRTNCRNGRLGYVQNFMLLVTLLPVVIGSVANILLHKKHWFEDVRAIMPAVAVVAFACIVGGVAAVHGHRFAESAS